MLHPTPLRAVPPSSPVRNRLLAALAPHDLVRLRPRLELVALVMGEAPTEPGHPITHVLFPEAGIVSVLAVSADKRHRIEVGLIG